MLLAKKSIIGKFSWKLPLRKTEKGDFITVIDNVIYYLCIVHFECSIKDNKEVFHVSFFGKDNRQMFKFNNIEKIGMNEYQFQAIGWFERTAKNFDVVLVDTNNRVIFTNGYYKIDSEITHRDIFGINENIEDFADCYKIKIAVGTDEATTVQNISMDAIIDENITDEEVKDSYKVVGTDAMDNKETLSENLTEEEAEAFVLDNADKYKELNLEIIKQ